MKADKTSLLRVLDQPNPGVRFYLFHGQDDAGSRALAERLLLGLSAEKSAVASGSIKSDPALLAAEAAALGLFGDRRLLWIEPAGDEIVAGVLALLESPAVESTVVAVAGALSRKSELLKLAEGHGLALSHVSYPLEGRDAERVVVDLGRAEGLAISHEVAVRVAIAAGNNRSVIASELAKFALYLDASPDNRKELDQDSIDLLGADSGEGDPQRIGDLALDGQLQELGNLLQRLTPGTTEIIPIVRTLQRRLLQLAPLRARIESGERLESVLTSMGKSLFWKDKPILQRLLSLWSAVRLEQLSDRIAALERRLMLTPVSADAALGEELFAIARAARR